MSINTIIANQALHRFDGQSEVWLFGYGSLIWKADFDYIERRPARIHGWARRFWQGSHDHRGTPQAPGRVVTLIPDPDAHCAGMAYLITPEVFDHLDHREKNGYLREVVMIEFTGDGSAQGEGPSGLNRDYFDHLADALRGLGESDSHIDRIEQELIALRGA